MEQDQQRQQGKRHKIRRQQGERVAGGEELLAHPYGYKPVGSEQDAKNIRDKTEGYTVVKRCTVQLRQVTPGGGVRFLS
jgi:hypothetical protein